MLSLTDRQRAVLDAFRAEEAKDPEGAFAPYYHTIVAAAGGDADVAYLTCKDLKKLGLLETNGRQGSALLNAPSYWPSEKGKAV